MHCRGPSADHVLARRQDQTTETAPGKSTLTHAHNHTKTQQKKKRVTQFLSRSLSTRFSDKILCFCFSSLTGPKHDPVNPESGPEDPERPAVCAENGSSAKGPGNKVQTGGGKPQAEYRQAIQGMNAFVLDVVQISVISCQKSEKSIFLHVQKSTSLFQSLPNTV